MLFCLSQSPEALDANPFSSKAASPPLGLIIPFIFHMSAATPFSLKINRQKFKNSTSSTCPDSPFGIGFFFPFSVHEYIQSHSLLSDMAMAASSLLTHLLPCNLLTI
jgi:hypothetical protein